MAAATVQQPSPIHGFDAVLAPSVATSNQAASRKPHNIETFLNYFKDNEDGSPPHDTHIDRPETYDRPVATHPTTITDVSGREAEYTLDGNGFQFHRHEAAEKDFLDDDKIKAGYYAETEQLLKDVTGASRIFIFDHTIRRNAPESGSRGRSLRGPVQRVHIDQSYDAALTRVPHHLPGEADALLRGRVQIINVWRPIRPVLRDPLAVAEAASVAEADLVPLGLVYPARRGETFGVRHNPEHRWFYKRGLAPDEVLLIKCFDTKTDGRARRVPHTAFVDPSAGPDVPARESIEVRALVFHPDDTE